jgi:ribosomal protein S18 acetylase RimI-like enzyme
MRSNSPALRGFDLRMDVHLRPARASDIGALSAIEEAVFPTDRISRHALARLVKSASAAIIVAAAGKGIAGYAVVLTRSGSGIARLYSIAAAPGRKGVGGLLLDAAEKFAVTRSKRAMRLEVRMDNARAIHLYERSGYRPIGRRDHYYQDGQTALRYEKPLSAAVSGREGVPPGKPAARPDL